jgi:hypothetical protein
MPQLDIILWFSQCLWVTICLILAFNAIRELYLKILQVQNRATYLKKKILYNFSFFMSLNHHLNLQKFWTYYLAK